MFTGIFVVLFWSYQRLIHPDEGQKVKLKDQEDEFYGERFSADEDYVSVLYRKSQTTESNSTNEAEQAEENQYDYKPDQGHVFGTIEFPTLARKISILQGTSEHQLRRGVGHYEKSAKPGEDDHCVLVGHHQTMFNGIETLKSGDLMIVKTSRGVFTYQVTGYQKTSLSKMIAIHQCDFAKLTLTTAHPNVTSNSPSNRHSVFATMISSDLA